MPWPPVSMAGVAAVRVRPHCRNLRWRLASRTAGRDCRLAVRLGRASRLCLCAVFDAPPRPSRVNSLSSGRLIRRPAARSLYGASASVGGAGNVRRVRALSQRVPRGRGCLSLARSLFAVVCACRKHHRQVRTAVRTRSRSLSVESRVLVPASYAGDVWRALCASVSLGYLVDPASSHMLVSKIKPCMSKYKRLVL